MQHPECLPTDLLSLMIELQGRPPSLFCIVTIFLTGSMCTFTNSTHELRKEDQVKLFSGEIVALQSYTFVVFSGEQRGAWPLLISPLAPTSLLKKSIKLIFLIAGSYLMDVHNRHQQNYRIRREDYIPWLELECSLCGWCVERS